MFEEYDILTEIIDSVNVDRTLHESINRALQYFIERSEYTPVFGLIYTIAQCRHRVNLLKHFHNFELNQHYIEKNKDLVHKSARCIYENKAYDSLFYFCKNFKLLKSLKTILQKEPRILEEEFVGLGTMNGIRLAYRVLQNEYRNDEQALKVIISRITDIPRNDEVRYMHFNFLMKLILIQKRVDEETRQQLIHMGEVKILKRNKHGIITLGRCLETVLLSQGMQSYKEFVEILGVNHIFTFKNEIPEVIPYRIYEISLEGVSKRRNDLRKIMEKYRLSDQTFIDFYMNSFYRYFVSIGDFFSIAFKGKQDRIVLKRLFNYELFGEVYFKGQKNKETEDQETENRETIDGRTIVRANFLNIVFRTIELNAEFVDDITLELMQKDDIFTCRLKRFNPRNQVIIIEKFRFAEKEKYLKYVEAVNARWSSLKRCFTQIINEESLPTQCIRELGSFPSVMMVELDPEDYSALVNDYAEVYSDVLLRLKDKPDEIIAFVKALDKSDNNLFSLRNTKSSFLPIKREDEKQVERAKATAEALLAHELPKESFIWLYLNSYLRLVLNFGAMLKSLFKSELHMAELETLFSDYRFFGGLLKTIRKNGRVICLVDAITFKNPPYGMKLGFYLNKENSVTFAQIKDNKMVSFLISRYIPEDDFLEVQDIWTQGEDEWNRNWKDLHDGHDQIKLYGTVKKDILDNLKMISKQTYRESEFKRLVEDFTWCMNRLCKEEDVLYQYLAALDKNNPFRYMDGEARKTIPAENVVYIKAQCDEILAQLIEHKYSLGKIFKIYLNSYLSLYLSVDEVFNAFNQKTGRGSRVRYLNEIMGVELQAEVSEISEENICFSLIQIPCQSRLFLLDSMEGEKEVLALGQKVSLSLINYDPMENAIGVELWHSSSL